MDAAALKSAFTKVQFSRAMAALSNDNAPSLPDLAPLRDANLSFEQRRLACAALVSAGKRSAASGRFDWVAALFLAAHALDPANHLLSERASLAAGIPKRDGVEWRLMLQDTQRQFHNICMKATCSCSDHYAVCKCLKMFGAEVPEKIHYRNLEIWTLAKYHVMSLSTPWSKIIKRMKHDFEGELVPFTGRVTADFIGHHTDLLRSVDLLVPVPPSPTKFERRGFAPTDQLSREISRMLGVPWKAILNRGVGVPTRQASDDELQQQFSASDQAKKLCPGSHVLLIEDVCTTGRTLSICARKLSVFNPVAISAVALAKSTRP